MDGHLDLDWNISVNLRRSQKLYEPPQGKYPVQLTMLINTQNKYILEDRRTADFDFI